jgi:galactokinase
LRRLDLYTNANLRRLVRDVEPVPPPTAGQATGEALAARLHLVQPSPTATAGILDGCVAERIADGRADVVADLFTDVAASFRRRYGRGARLFRAPGRVNLIGEHTDYCDGFVMPAAIDLQTVVAAAPREDRRVRLASANVAGTIEIDLDDLDPRPRKHWSDYVRGVALMLGRAGVRLRGADLRVGTSIPIGGGLGSSAALEVAAGQALLTLAAAPVELRALALACQRAENEVVGNRCGIMDPFIACFGEAGRVVLLDCRSLDHRALPLPDGVRVVVCDTLVRHQLAGSEYNARRADCEESARRLGMGRCDVGALRDLTLEDLERGAARLPPVVLRRCRHVIGENTRVLDATAALDRGDLAGFGLLISASHRSLRDDYEVSCRELDLLVELAAPVQGVYGTRMTGGGFGGCTVTLVRADGVQSLVEAVTAGYREATGRTPQVHVCSLDAGVAEVTPRGETAA